LGRHARRRLSIGGLAVIVPILAVVLAVLINGSSSSGDADQTVSTKLTSSAERATPVSRDGGEHVEPSAPLPKPVAGTHLMVDMASAPPLSTVRAWQKKSPYRAIGVYVDVTRVNDDRHDKVQRNLTPGWVSQVQAGGWKVLPIYLGLQAPRACQSGGFHAMSSSPVTAQQQGIAAADDAARSTAALGLGSVPVMYDMEHYSDGCSDAVRAFFLGWTSRLHQLDRLSGIYGSPTSLGHDLLAAGAHYPQPDVLWAVTANGSASTAVRQLPRQAWRGARANQFALDVKRHYGGKKLGVDDSAVDDGVWKLTHVAGPDKAAPALTMGYLAPTVRGQNTTLRWSGVDEDSASVAYQLQARRTASGSPVGSWSSPAAAGRALTMRLNAGDQFCVRVRANDQHGNVSSWTSRCTSRLIDDKQLQHGRGWHRTHLRGAQKHSVITAKWHHAVLKLGHAERGRVGVAVQGRGAVNVLLDGHRVGVLRSGGVRWVRVPHAGEVTLTSSTAHVAVDGYALAAE
jgi:hypothetical protein